MPEADSDPRPPLSPMLLGGLSLVVVLAVLNDEVAPGALDWIQDKVGFQWVSITALIAVSFSGGYALAIRDRALRSVAPLLFFAAVYALDVAAGFDEDGDVAGTIDRLTWWAIPLALAAWAQASWVISSEVRAGTGLRASLSRLWRHPAWWGGVLLPALAFAAAGSVPRLLFEQRAAPLDWGGRRTDVHALFWLFAGWSAIPLIGSAVLLWIAWRDRDEDIDRDRAQHGYYALGTAFALVVIAVLLVGTPLRLWPEALLAGLLALCFLWFVLLLAQASSSRDLRRRGSTGRRALGAVFVISLLTAAAALSTLPPLNAGLIAAFAAGGWPLYETINRSLFGYVRPRPPARQKLRGQTTLEGAATPAAGTPPPGEGPALPGPSPPPARPEAVAEVQLDPDAEISWDDRPILDVSAEESEALRHLMAHGIWPSVVPVERGRKVELAAATLRDLQAFAATLGEGKPPPLRVLLNAQGRESHRSSLPDSFRDLLLRLPALPGGVVTRIHVLLLLEMVRQTARRLRCAVGGDERDQRDPPALRALEAECAMRTRALAREPQEKEDLEALIARYRAWRAGDPRPWSELETLTAAEVRIERSGRVDRDRTKKLRARRIDAAAREVLDAWIATLEEAAAN